ncbi:MAG: peptide ABC transporter substrate-binding protein [Chloroflexi bacterium]|nr:peptide ABC transporter substrate-binding protein [Chloroflexota bacterium]
MRIPFMGWRLLAVVGLAVAGLFVLAACKEEKAGPSGDLAADQVARLWLTGEPTSVDPSLADFDVATTMAKNLFATLLRFDPVEGVLHPYAAEEIPTKDNGGVSADGLTYTYHIREDAVWEDGEPMTADNFVYSLSRLLDPRIGSYYGTTFYNELIEGGTELSGATDATEAEIADLKDALGLRAVDARTLEIKLTRISHTFNLLMALWVTAGERQDVIEKYGDITNSKWTEAGNVVASGPFRLAQWQHGRRLVLEPNPAFWDEELTPTLTRLVFEIIEDENTAFSAYQTGEVDMVEVPLANLKTVEADPNLSKELVRVPQAGTFGFDFNHREPPFDDVNARRAFCAAIDRATLVDEIAQGRGNPTTAWYPPSLVPYFDEARGAELAFDADAAKADLDAYGKDPGQVKFTFANVATNPGQVEFLQGQWGTNLDANVKLDPLDAAAFQDAYNEGNYTMAFVGWVQDYSHPENWMIIWKTGGLLNTSGYSNPDFDKTVDDAIAEEDPAKEEALWKRAEEILVDEDVAMCPLVNHETVVLVKPYVRDFIITGVDGHPGDNFYWKTAVLEH